MKNKNTLLISKFYLDSFNDHIKRIYLTFTFTAFIILYTNALGSTILLNNLGMFDKLAKWLF